jgi:ubiquinone/menaquinone biosynthesis C-methylase UbiE
VSAVYSVPTAWAEGAHPAYRKLADAAIEESPRSLEGEIVLDVGAATGSVSEALAAAGASPVAVDISHAMLSHDRARRPPATAADALRLPFKDSCMGGAVIAFVLSHTEEPELLLSEAARVAAPAAPVLATVFASADKHPTKALVAEVAGRHGFVPPAWYQHISEVLQERVADPRFLLRIARETGLHSVAIVEREVDTGLASAEELVAWRLGTPALASFVSSLDPDKRRALWEDAVAAARPWAQPLRLAVRILVSQSPAKRVNVSA